jgi:hypothetical protein
MNLTKLANYFGVWHEKSLILEKEETSLGEVLKEVLKKVLKKVLKEEIQSRDGPMEEISPGEVLNEEVQTELIGNLEMIEQLELDEIIKLEKGEQLETGEYIERGIIFSKKPNLNSNKYKKQISIGGTGGLMNYMIGIIQIIRENFDLDDCIITGTSGGCLSAFLLVTPKDKIEIDDFLDHCDDNLFCQDFLDLLSNSIIGCNGRVNSSYHIIWNKILERYFPNLETREKEVLGFVKDRLYISTTNIKGFKNFIINDWDSMDDLIESMLSSMTIPIWSQWTIARSYKKHWLIDGGFSNSTPQIFLQMPILNLECLKWRQFSYMDFYPSYKYKDHSKFKKLGMLDALEHLNDLENFFEQRAKCRQYLSNPDHPFHIK